MRCDGAGDAGALVAAGALLFVALLLIPRRERAAECVGASQRDYPALHRIVGSVADAIRAPRPDTMVLTWEFNAFTTHVGLRRRRQLALGLPMLTALDPQQWVALIGHELGHFCNGDVTRGFWTGTALNTIGAWHEILEPDTITEHDEGIAGHCSRFVMWLLSLIPAAIYRPFAWLSWASAQRGEYFADRMSALAGGTAAAVGLLEQSLAPSVLEHACHAVVHAQAKVDFFEEIERLTRERPERERERLRRQAAIEPSSLDASHPPTGMRIRMLRERPATAAQVVVDPEDVAAIRRELAPARARVGSRIVDAYRSSLYA